MQIHHVAPYGLERLECDTLSNHDFWSFLNEMPCIGNNIRYFFIVHISTTQGGQGAPMYSASARLLIVMLTAFNEFHSTCNTCGKWPSESKVLRKDFSTCPVDVQKGVTACH